VKDSLVAIEAIIVGVVSTMLLFWLGNKIVEVLPNKIRKTLQPCCCINLTIFNLSNTSIDLVELHGRRD
jgi:hypothetical protein